MIFVAMKNATKQRSATAETVDLVFYMEIEINILLLCDYM